MMPYWPEMLQIGENEWFAWNEDQADFAVRLIRGAFALVDRLHALMIEDGRHA